MKNASIEAKTFSVVVRNHQRVLGILFNTKALMIFERRIGKNFTSYLREIMPKEITRQDELEMSKLTPEEREQSMRKKLDENLEKASRVSFTEIVALMESGLEGWRHDREERGAPPMEPYTEDYACSVIDALGGGFKAIPILADAFFSAINRDGENTNTDQQDGPAMDPMTPAMEPTGNS